MTTAKRIAECIDGRIGRVIGFAAAVVFVAANAARLVLGLMHDWIGTVLVLAAVAGGFGLFWLWARWKTRREPTAPPPKLRPSRPMKPGKKWVRRWRAADLHS